MNPKLVIKSDKIIKNIDLISQKAQKPIIAVIKDNFYGFGIKECLPTFEKDQRVVQYAVADLAEYFKISALTKRPIIVFKRLAKAELLKLVDDQQIEVVVDNLAYLKEMAPYLKSFKLHLKLNTGMNRNGIDLDELPELISFLKQKTDLKWHGIFSHFYHLEDDYAINNHQIVVFKKMYESVKLATNIQFKMIHMQASSGVLLVNDPLFTHVRPGFMLTGLSPFSYPVKELSQIGYIQSMISQIHQISYGSIGYGPLIEEYQGKRIGVVPIGYAFGFTRAHTNSKVEINQKLYPIIGKISTDYLFVEIDETVKLNDQVKLLKEYDYHQHDIVNYEAFTLLNERITREVK